ncbi:hypothetical protein JFQ93_003169 [Aeromonas sobria]|nr:hypothetical protein [Aeromonas sobria]
MTKRQAELKTGARLTLFLVSYLPLFIIMSFAQLYKYKDFLHWGGFEPDALKNFIVYFGAISVLGVLSLFGIVGLLLLFKNVKRRAETSGTLVTILDIENKNSESISYLFTYIIPFVFQDLSELTNVVSVSILLVVTFLIYSNSSMLLINPTISIKYSLYMTEYKTHSSDKKMKGMIISKNRFLEEDDQVKIKKIGHKLFFAVDNRS